MPSLLRTLARLALPALALGARLPQAKRQSITTLTSAQIAAFTPYTWFASSAYCAPSSTLSWTCGANCNANPGFVPLASGGDGDATQFWYVGYDPTLQEVIVAHQGTDTSEILADLTDADFILGPLDTALFPGVSSSVTVHEGFRNEQAKAATTILADVKAALAAHGATKVTTVGHSLGAALSLLDALYLSLNLPSSVSVKFVGYGLPRVGDQDFANLMDSTRVSITHINNKKDPIPILPPMLLGFHHPSGEVHIQASGAWDACPGQDNPSTLCIVGDEPTILSSNASDHEGPYNGIEMGC